MSLELEPIYLEVKMSKVKVTRHKQPVSVFRHNAILPLAAYKSNAGFSLLQCPATQATLATPGFSRVMRDRQTAGPIFRACSFSQSASGKNIAGVGHGIL